MAQPLGGRIVGAVADRADAMQEIPHVPDFSVSEGAVI